jgi:L-cysteine:1D-myo-inositol 2-amino-2-deoxy-alpha-D-glucopyranoside ligase
VWLSQRKAEPSWASPFGEGNPGWHIECCAIALHYLAPDSNDEYAIDIQGGGSDLIFPHHEMSAAQSRLIIGQKFARSYVHTGMVGLNGEKMSKSLGNLVFCLDTHGRKTGNRACCNSMGANEFSLCQGFDVGANPH